MSHEVATPNIENLLKAYLDGESVNSISKRLRIGRHVINLWLERRGIHRRTRSEAELVKWSRMTKNERLNQVSKAHAAVRGVTRGDREMELRAIRRNRRIGAGEAELVEFLAERGVEVDAQRPVGRYNIDIAIDSVAVEVYRQAFHPIATPTQRKRVVDLFGRGHVTLYVWISFGQGIVPECADKVVALLDVFCRNPAEFGQYRVIRGTGEDVPVLPFKGHYIANIKRSDSAIDFGRDYQAISGHTICN